MQTHFAKPPARSQSYTKFSTPLVLEPPLHCGLPTIRLGVGKHLLGTDDCCTVRVRADNVEPRHALIVVSEHRTVVKALHSQTWVNEGPVSEMALRPGDRLSLGPLTFRVRAARLDELADFQATNAGTFPDDDSFPNDDLMNRHATPEPSWRVGASSGLTHEAPPSVASAASAFGEKSASATFTLEAANVAHVEHRDESVPVERSLVAEQQFAASDTELAAHSAREIAAPTAVAPVEPAPLAGPNSLVAVSVHEAVALAGVTAFNEPAPRGDTGAARPALAPKSSSPALDLRLEEIAQKLAELDRPDLERVSSQERLNVPERSRSSERPPSPDETAAHSESLAAERRHVLEQQNELQQRVEELARQTEQLLARVARVTEREADANRVQSQSAREHERLRVTTEATRRELAEEYSRHQTLWQEWDSAYRRTSAELNEQLQSLEQRRTAQLADTDRLALERSHVQRLVAEQERDRREVVALRAQLSNDHVALKSLRDEFGDERQQHLAAIQERAVHVDLERRASVAMHAELLAARQQFERDRTAFLTERAAAATLRDRERFELVERRERLDQDVARLQADRGELDGLRHALEAERADFAAERGAIMPGASPAERDESHDAVVPDNAAVRDEVAVRDEAAHRERFVDPYAVINLPPLLVGRPCSTFARTSLAPTEPTVSLTPSASRTSFTDPDADEHFAERFVDPYADVPWPLLDSDGSCEDAIETWPHHDQPAPTIPTATFRATAASSRFVDPYAGFLSSLEVVVTEAQATAAFEPGVVESGDLEPGVACEDTPQSESPSVVLSSPDGELPDDESPGDERRDDEPWQPDLLTTDGPRADAKNDRVACEEVVRDDIPNKPFGDNEYASSLPLTDSTSTAHSTSAGTETPSAGVKPRANCFWEDNSVYGTSASLSAGEIPVFDAAAFDRMSDGNSDGQGTTSVTVAASLNVDPGIPNSEFAEGFASEDSVELWCRSFDETLSKTTPDSEAATEPETVNATATLEEPLSIDETLAEINREFGVPFAATTDFAFEPSATDASEPECAELESSPRESVEIDFSLFDSPIFLVREVASQELAAPCDERGLGSLVAESGLVESGLTDAESSALTADDIPAIELTAFEIPVVEFTADEPAVCETHPIEISSEEFFIPEVIEGETESNTDLQVGSATGLSELPAWWKECESGEIPIYDGPHYADDVAREVAEGLIAAPDDGAEVEAPQHAPKAAAPSDPLASLRAQLAQMFDMKAETTTSSDADLVEEMSAEEDPANEHARDDAVAETVETDGESEAPESPNETAGSFRDENATAEEDHALPDNSAITASASPAPEESPSASAIQTVGEDDSVENYMARLLSRARGSATVSPTAAKSLAAAAVRASASSTDSSDELPATEAVPFDPTDRSHLKAEPKHKQDRQAARDDLQSFRQVAHLSARSALARHTTKNLLSTLIAKSFLLGVSSVAAIAYFGAPLVGWPSELWNGAACSLAALLSAIEFHRSWSKLRRSYAHGQPPKKKATPPATPALASTTE